MTPPVNKAFIEGETTGKYMDLPEGMIAFIVRRPDGDRFCCVTTIQEVKNCKPGRIKVFVGELQQWGDKTVIFVTSIRTQRCKKKDAYTSA